MQLFLMVVAEFAGSIPGKTESLLTRARGAVEEARQGSYFSETFNIVVAKKDVLT